MNKDNSPLYLELRELELEEHRLLVDRNFAENIHVREEIDLAIDYIQERMQQILYLTNIQ